MCQSVYYLLREQFELLVIFLPIIMVDTKIVFGSNFLALLIWKLDRTKYFKNQI